jgi:proline iminopeptidase
VSAPSAGIEPHAHGMLPAGDGNTIAWEVCGNPVGKPAVVLHGGPGSGCSPWHRSLFDPARYRVVLFDQRGCGRSTPHASDPATGLSTNTTPHLLADIELLRRHLGIERWLVLGGSWGSTLALAYAEAHPERVSEMVLFGVTTGRRSEFDWLFRGGVAAFFPEHWARLQSCVLPADRGGDVVEAYVRMLDSSDPAVRQRAAYEWCLWESATPSWPPVTGLAPRFADPAYAVAYARLVTHYVRHDGFIEDGSLLRGATVLAGISGVLVNGRSDFQSPIANAWELQRVWPSAELVIVDNAGHAAGPEITAELVRATNRFARRPGGGQARGGAGPPARTAASVSAAADTGRPSGGPPPR